MSFGSTEDRSADLTAEEVAEMKELAAVKNMARKTATVQGVSIELQVQKQQINTLNDKLDSLIGLISTLQNQQNTFQTQRAIELNSMVNHGSTTPEDM